MWYPCLDVRLFLLGDSSWTIQAHEDTTGIISSLDLQTIQLGETNALGGFVYWKRCEASYGLPNSGILDNGIFINNMTLIGFYKVAHKPGLQKHTRLIIYFSLHVDDFRVKCAGKEHIHYLHTSLCKDNSKIIIDWTGWIGWHCLDMESPRNMGRGINVGLCWKVLAVIQSQNAKKS